MIQVAADQPEGLTVQRDGVPLGAASLGVALPLDPASIRSSSPRPDAGR